MPIILVANKIDMDPSRATKSFAFLEQINSERSDKVPIYFVSASDGSNVVTIFKEAIKKAAIYKKEIMLGNSDNFIDQIMGFIEEGKTKQDGMISRMSEPIIDQ